MSHLVRIIERVWGNIVLLECGHQQEVSTFPKSRTICGTCHPAERQRAVERARWKWLKRSPNEDTP